MKPILIHLHIYYEKYVDNILNYLQNINYIFELCVTIVEKNTCIEAKILSKFPFAKIIEVENFGYDIYPFIKVIEKIDLNDFSYVIKIHTKRNVPLGVCFNGIIVSRDKWRNYLFSFISKKENFDKTIQEFERNDKLGMVGDFRLILREEPNDENSKDFVYEILKKLQLPTDNYGFVAGTVFVCRTHLLNKLKCIKHNNYFFNSVYNAKGHKISYPHVVERLIGCLILSQGYIIDDVYTSSIRKNLLNNRAFRKLINNVFYIGESNKNHRLYLKVFSIRVPLGIKMERFNKN